MLQVSMGALVSLVIILLVCFVLPLAFFYVLYRAECKFKTMAIGALAYLVCGIIADTMLVMGLDAIAEPIRYRRRLGWLDEEAPAVNDLTVKSYLKYRARLKGEQSRKIRHRVQEAISVCALEPFVDVTVACLSRGQRKRVALAEAALLRPRLLLLDDLFAGLDAESRESVVTMIGSFRSFATVIVSGHEMEWFSRLGARVLTLKEGRIA